MLGHTVCVCLHFMCVWNSVLTGMPTVHTFLIGYMSLTLLQTLVTVTHHKIQKRRTLKNKMAALGLGYYVEGEIKFISC